jgi:hypothetical protein
MYLNGLNGGAHVSGANRGKRQIRRFTRMRVISYMCAPYFLVL